MTTKYGTFFLLLDAITDEKTDIDKNRHDTSTTIPLIPHLKVEGSNNSGEQTILIVHAYTLIVPTYIDFIEEFPSHDRGRISEVELG